MQAVVILIFLPLSSAGEFVWFNWIEFNADVSKGGKRWNVLLTKATIKGLDLNLFTLNIILNTIWAM